LPKTPNTRAHPRARLPRETPSAHGVEDERYAENQLGRVCKAEKKWRSITIKAHAVKPDPFFKTVRPQVSSDVIVGSFVTARTYTTCFTGITVPFVCTSGSEVCGN
jgi:hypothetical protein